MCEDERVVKLGNLGKRNGAALPLGETMQTPLLRLPTPRSSLGFLRIAGVARGGTFLLNANQNGILRHSAVFMNHHLALRVRF